MLFLLMLDQFVVDAEKYMEEMTLLEKLRFILAKKTLGHSLLRIR